MPVLARWSGHAGTANHKKFSLPGLSGLACAVTRLTLSARLADVSVRVHPGRLRIELARRGWAAADLARSAGVSAPTISTALAGRPISAQSLQKLAIALTAAPCLDVIDKLILTQLDDHELT
jgi:lambda repressor-like predicted transcriptional regulator